MITHDLDSLKSICDRVAALANGKIVTTGSVASLQASQHPWVSQYFKGRQVRDPASPASQHTT
jgi:phospholipid/cholesterol/gamma-HCH transport system ATP-binding protein